MDEKPLLKVGLGDGMMDLDYIVTRVKDELPDANLIFEGVPKDKMESSLKYIKSILNK